MATGARKRKEAVLAAIEAQNWLTGIVSGECDACGGSFRFNDHHDNYDCAIVRLYEHERFGKPLWFGHPNYRRTAS